MFKIPEMDTPNCAQDVLCCSHCENSVIQSHCELCNANVCKDCVGEHLSDSSKNHRVVPFKAKFSTFTYNYPKCSIHAIKHCEMYCETCDIPVCSGCISSGKHQEHKIADFFEKHSTKREKLETDLKELEGQLNPRYEGISSNIQIGKANLEKYCTKLTNDVIKQGNDWHKEIDIVVDLQKSEITALKNKHVAFLNKQENEIKCITSELQNCILEMKKILKSSDLSLICAYKSRNGNFRKLPPKFKISFPRFVPSQYDKQSTCHQLIGSLSALSIMTEERGYKKKASEDVSPLSDKSLLDEPKLISTINTGYGLTSVACRRDEEIWTCERDEIIKLYNLHGELLSLIETKSKNEPGNIAVAENGILIYTDPVRRTVNVVRDRQTQERIRLQEWKPYYVCITSSEDLLVTMLRDDAGQSRVVRYSGSKEKQIIQYDDKDCPLYSSDYRKYICENRNLDICVADNKARAVVVVNQAGELRFRYNGHPSSTTKSIDPVGITTDSQGLILVADSENNCIHILDQDGGFLFYIDKCNLHLPYGLCVDTKDNLFVAELISGKVKKIQYK